MKPYRIQPSPVKISKAWYKTLKTLLNVAKYVNRNSKNIELGEHLLVKIRKGDEHSVPPRLVLNYIPRTEEKECPATAIEVTPNPQIFLFGIRRLSFYFER